MNPYLDMTPNIALIYSPARRLPDNPMIAFTSSRRPPPEGDVLSASKSIKPKLVGLRQPRALAYENEGRSQPGRIEPS